MKRKLKAFDLSCRDLSIFTRVDGKKCYLIYEVLYFDSLCDDEEIKIVSEIDYGSIEEANPIIKKDAIVYHRKKGEEFRVLDVDDENGVKDDLLHLIRGEDGDIFYKALVNYNSFRIYVDMGGDFDYELRKFNKFKIFNIVIK